MAPEANKILGDKCNSKPKAYRMPEMMVHGKGKIWMCDYLKSRFNLSQTRRNKKVLKELALHLLSHIADDNG